MTRPALLSLLAFAVAAALTAWWLQQPDAGAPVAAGEPGAPAEPGGPDVVAAVVDDAARREIPGGSGRLEVDVVLGRRGVPMPLELRAEPLAGGPAVDLLPTGSIRRGTLAAKLPAGRYRLVVTRGPGDPYGARTSGIWTVDPPQDLVDILAEATLRLVVRAVERVGAPDRGTAVLRGVAFLDGKPATDLVVRTDAASGSRTGHVAADGSFDLGEVPSGLLRVELCSRRLRSGRGDGGMLIYGFAEVAPQDGAIAEVAIRAATTALRGRVLSASELPRNIVGLDLLGDAVGMPTPFTPEPIGGARIPIAVDPDGAFVGPAIPPGAYALVANGPEHAGAAVRFRVEPGDSEVVVEVPVARRVPVSGTVEVGRLPRDRAPGGWMRVRFRGPIDRTVSCRDGTFATSLIPGTYRAEFSGRGWGHRAQEPIQVEEDGAVGLRLMPVRQR